MVLEIADFIIRSGHKNEFAVAYRRAAHLLRDTPGCLSVRMTRGTRVALPVRAARRVGGPHRPYPAAR